MSQEPLGCCELRRQAVDQTFQKVCLDHAVRAERLEKLRAPDVIWGPDRMDRLSPVNHRFQPQSGPRVSPQALSGTARIDIGTRSKGSYQTDHPAAGNEMRRNRSERVEHRMTTA